MQEFLGAEHFVNQKGEEVSYPTKKYTMLYFSAHWCPPCRGFTPKLKEFHEKHAASLDFEVIFFSGDRCVKDADEYFKNDHGDYLMLPYEFRSVDAKVSKKLGVRGIPCLAVFETATGKLLTTKATGPARAAASGDAGALKAFPWTQKTLPEILASAEMKSKGGDKLDLTSFKDGFAIYFSGSFCPPCRKFTPKLVSAYTALKASGKNMEIVFSSADRSRDDYDEYYKEMPWATIEYGARAIAELDDALGIEGVPTLVTFSADGKIINKDAVGDASEDPTAWPWAPVPLEVGGPLAPRPATFEALNSNINVVLVMPNKDASKTEFLKAATRFDSETNAKQEEDDKKVRFFFVDRDNQSVVELFSRVCGALKIDADLGKTETALLCFNLPNNRASDIMHKVPAGDEGESAMFEKVTSFHKAQQ